MTKYKCICGKRAVTYIDHHTFASSPKAITAKGFVDFECSACGLGKDRHFCFPPAPLEVPIYSALLPLFREMGDDVGFYVDPLTGVLHDPLERLWDGANKFLDCLEECGFDTSFLLIWLEEQGIEVRS